MLCHHGVRHDELCILCHCLLCHSPLPWYQFLLHYGMLVHLLCHYILRCWHFHHCMLCHCLLRHCILRCRRFHHCMLCRHLLCHSALFCIPLCHGLLCHQFLWHHCQLCCLLLLCDDALSCCLLSQCMVHHGMSCLLGAIVLEALLPGLLPLLGYPLSLSFLPLLNIFSPSLFGPQFFIYCDNFLVLVSHKLLQFGKPCLKCSKLLYSVWLFLCNQLFTYFLVQAMYFCVFLLNHMPNILSIMAVWLHLWGLWRRDWSNISSFRVLGLGCMFEVQGQWISSHQRGTGGWCCLWSSIVGFWCCRWMFKWHLECQLTRKKHWRWSLKWGVNRLQMYAKWVDQHGWWSHGQWLRRNATQG